MGGRAVKGIKELSLRPYTGRLFVAKSRKAYERAHLKLFDEPDVLTCAQAGLMTGGKGKDGFWTYLIFADSPHCLAHELSHVILCVFEDCHIDPREANGEPFCYLLSQLMLEAG